MIVQHIIAFGQIKFVNADSLTVSQTSNVGGYF